MLGVWSVSHIALDALPDLSDTQVIVYSRWDRSPDIIEDQVTYPIITSLLGAPKVKAIRGFSDFGFSYVYVIFDEGTDLYWARSRTLEYLSKIQPRLPQGVQTELGPDATGVGWVFQYALVDDERQALARRPSLHPGLDDPLRPSIGSRCRRGREPRRIRPPVPGHRRSQPARGLRRASDVASSRRSGPPTTRSEAGSSNGAAPSTWSAPAGTSKSVADLEEIVVKTNEKGTPVRLRDVAQIELGPEIRRGIAELDGKGEVAAGIVVMRHGENAMNVIGRVKERLKAIEPTLPAGVKIVTTYDRSELIERSIKTLKHELILEMLIVSLIILIFLWHIPSAVIPIVTIPAAVILSFIPMNLFGISSNIMSLGGIAVAIGALVDAAVVVVENAHKKLEVWEATGRKGDYKEILIGAIQEVGRPSFFSLLVIAVAFMPIFALEAQEGRLFRPARVHEELRDGDRGAPRDHARSGDPASLHEAQELRLQAPLSLPRSPTRSSSERCTRRRSTRSRACSSSSTGRRRGSSCDIRGRSSPRRSSSCWRRSRPTSASAPSSCRP